MHDRQWKTVESAAEVIDEIGSIPEKAIPAALLHDAQGIAIIPDVIKVGFVLSGRFGHGVVILREPNGHWGNPIFLTLTGGNIGWQIGAQSTDVVLVFKTRRSADDFLKGKKFTLGADVAIAAGPIGREAEAGTDPKIQAEIVSYSRSRGLFAGVSLGGTELKVDHAANAAFYQRPNIPPAVIVAGGNLPVPVIVLKLRTTLDNQERPILK
jgi:lipid-binding SYLF domain-containing protein